MRAIGEGSHAWRSATHSSSTGTPGADVPEFTFDLVDEQGVTVGYRSARKLCALAEGFIAGAARHYGGAVDIHHSECMLDGADHCAIRCRFEPAEGNVACR